MPPVSPAPSATPSPTATLVLSPIISSTMPHTATPHPSPSATARPSPSASPTSSPTHTPGPPPRVVASYPIENDHLVGAHRPLIIEFDHPMDPSSVLARLTISPTTEGQAQWPDARRMVYVPANPWRRATYELTLASGAMDTQGASLREPFRLHFASGDCGRSFSCGVPVPILMYHHILNLDAQASSAQRTWTVAPEAFAQQMRYLADHGWQSISPTQLIAYFQGQPLPPRPIIITMDDGYKEVFTAAYPIFMETGLRPILFIVPQYVEYKAYLHWEELRALVADGFAIGAHGYDHSNLRKAGAAGLKRQLEDSRALLAERLGTTVDAFCYPNGSYDARTLAALETYHYTSAFTLNPTIWQSPEHPYQLGRLRVSYDTTMEEFALLLPRLDRP